MVREVQLGVTELYLATHWSRFVTNAFPPGVVCLVRGYGTVLLTAVLACGQQPHQHGSLDPCIQVDSHIAATTS